MSAADDGVQQTADMTTPLNLDANPLFAEFGVRMAGVGLDLFIAVFIAEVVPVNVIEAIGLTVTDHRPINLAVFLLYCSVFWSSPLRATPAQLLFGMRVVDEMGERLSLGRAVVRGVLLIGLIAAAMTIIGIPSTPYLGVVALVGYPLLFLAALTPNRQAGHDLLVHSLVVNKIALKSRERLAQLREHVSDSDPVSRKQRRPSVKSIVENMIVLVIPVIVLLVFAQVGHDMNLRSRIGYAVGEVAMLKFAVEEYYAYYTGWPTKESELGVATRVNYPDGGYYELEDDGVIRIRFTVKPALKKGSIVVSPTVEEDRITWECHADGDFAKKYLIAGCRE